MRSILYSASCTVVILLALSCNPVYDGEPGSRGDLPSNFISIKDSGFTPVSLTVVSGSSVTFINNTSTTKTLYSVDSVVIKRAVIPAGDSYKFIKNYNGSFQYFDTARPAVLGTLNFTQ